MTRHCLKLTHYVADKMKAMGIAAWCNKHSNIVVFPRPADRIIKKRQIATYDHIAHFIIMPHHTKAFFDSLLEDFP